MCMKKIKFLLCLLPIPLRDGPFVLLETHVPTYVEARCSFYHGMRAASAKSEKESPSSRIAHREC